ncbi:MAG: helicase-exonuclease AddAB subunit AddA, partial [Clostridia bacterium]|nr:helicase-exonuclease AddAB subunit AddA [Clostridia bacterium]
MQQQHGSGKTAVLVERIINKIINEKVDIDKLLVVTFTNAAAAEMRERILNAIYKKIEESESQEEQDNLQRQIVLLNKASICTIDSFCLDVIRNNFYEIDVSPNFRIGDNAEVELLKQETLEEIFEEKYESQDADFETLIKTYTSYRDDTPLKELILKIFGFTESSPYPRKWLEEKIQKFNIKDISADFANTVWGKLLIEEIKEELIDDIGTLRDEARKLSIEKDLILWQKILENDAMELEILLNNLDSWDKAYTISNSVEFITWARNKTDFVELKDEAKLVRDTVKKKFKEKCDKIFVSNSEEANKDILNMYEKLTKLKNLIFEFEDRFIKKKKDKNILDFSDIEHLALKILVDEDENGKHKRSEIAKKYQDKFVEIAIDEYQDSNLVQEYILTSVSNGKNIFMVGDVKQSIYRFRQAMPELFLDKYKNYSLNESNEKGLKIQLFKNFRSRKNVLDFTNIIFENIMSETLGDIEYTEEEYLNLGADYQEKEEGLKLNTEIDIIDIKDEKEDTIDEEGEDQETEKIEDIELEAKFVANKIKELVDNKTQIYDTKKQEFRDIKYKDIVVLLRSTKNKAPVFEKELINKDIPVFSDTSSQYLDSIEIHTILSLLKIIDNPMQDIPLVSVMLSSIGKFTNNDLVEIRLIDKYSDFYTTLLKAKLSVSQTLREKIDTFLSKLERWREQKEYLALDELIWTIYEDTNFLNYVGILPNGALRQANLKMLFERAKQYESVSFKGLFNFINFIEKLKLGSGDLSSAKLIGENEDVVRIMSIHKSKGLEFPVVFLTSTGTGFNLMDLNNDILLHQDLGIGVKYIDYDMQIKYDTLSKQALRNKLYEETLSEEMRVLYVALTRAKEKIYITGITRDYEKEIESKKNLIGIYKKETDKINPILVKKYKSYLDWIELVYLYDSNMSDISELNVYKKSELAKSLKVKEKEEVDIFKVIEENCKNVTQESLQEIEDKLSFRYKHKLSTEIPTKTSVTAIVHQDLTAYSEENIAPGSDDGEEIELILPKPKFLNNQEDEKVTPSQRGTVIHLCMKKLDFSKEYNLQDVKTLIQDLVNHKFITQKEADSINPYQILQFTKSNIWNDLKHAKEYHKEEPFYINEQIENENILVQGIIDLYYIDKNDNLVLLDYKTD